MSVDVKYTNCIKNIIFNNIKNRDVEVILYGSRARGNAYRTSDFDIALMSEKKIQISLIRKIKEELEESTIPYKVDIVDVNTVDAALKTKIKKDGVIWKNST